MVMPNKFAKPSQMHASKAPNMAPSGASSGGGQGAGGGGGPAGGGGSSGGGGPDGGGGADGGDSADAGPDVPQPQPPPNTKEAVAMGLRDMADNAQTFSTYASIAANPIGTAKNKAMEALAKTEAGKAVAALSNAIAAMLPPFPAATMTSLALGAPHAHVAHPPSGPPPIPPTPLPPMGPVMIGTCLQVLINGKPAARSGDLGLNPTCCGLPPMFEIFTGSSKVFIGGGRAARAGIDITMHCTQAGGARAGAMAAKVAAKASMMAKIAKLVGTVASAAGKVAQATEIAADFAEAEVTAEDDAALGAAMGLSASMAAAQMAADIAAMALGMMMGKDPCVPPTGTPGMILVGSPNVLIGGFPMPNMAKIADGLMKKIKGKARKHTSKLPGIGTPSCR